MMSVESDGLIVQFDATGDVFSLALAGELDVANVGIVRDLLDKADGVAQRDVIVELSDLQLLSASGIGVLVATARRLERAGRTLRVTNPQPVPRRALHVLGLDWLVRPNPLRRTGQPAA